MEYQAIREVLHEHFKGVLEKTKRRLAIEGRLSPLEKDAFENGQGFAEDALEEEDYTYAGDDVSLARIINRYELPIQQNSKDYAVFRTEFLKAFRDYCSAVLKHNADFDKYDFKDSVPMGTASKRKERKLTESIEVFCAEKERNKHWRAHVAKENRAQLGLLLEYLGKGASLHISPEVASDVKAMLLRLPSNRNKGRLKHLTLNEQLKDETAARLSPVTVNKRLVLYSSFYDWAVKRKETDENNFRALIDNVENALKPRTVFTLEQTRLILNAAMEVKSLHHKWGVLVAFYTGARLNEIAQLDTTNIIRVEGIPCFNFTDEGEGQSLKTASSKRVVPIHSRLIELGFLEVVKDAGRGRLFSKLSLHNNRYGRSIGRWVNDSLLPELGIKAPNLTYHSIRHTVAAQLRNNKVPEATLKDILGHAHRDVTMGVYAKNLDKRVMQEAIETLKY